MSQGTAMSVKQSRVAIESGPANHVFARGGRGGLRACRGEIRAKLGLTERQARRGVPAASSPLVTKTACAGRVWLTGQPVSVLAEARAIRRDQWLVRRIHRKLLTERLRRERCLLAPRLPTPQYEVAPANALW